MRGGAVGAGLLAVLIGCTIDFGIPLGAEVVCADNGDCPPDHICHDSERVCVAVSDNRAPEITVDPIPRTTSVIAFDVAVTDAESDRVTLRVKLLRGSIEQVIDVDGAEVAATPEGVTTTVRWDAPSFFGSTAFVGDLRLRVTPLDATSLGSSVTTGAFAFGNSPPGLTGLQVDRRPDGSVGGQAVVRFRAVDPDGDPLSLTTFELAGTAPCAGSDPLRIPTTTINFPGSDIDALASDVAGVAHAVTWDSPVAATYDCDGVTLRVGLSDPVEDTNVEELLIDLRNLPRVTPAAAVATAQDQLSLGYLLADSNFARHKLDLRIQYTVEPDPLTATDWRLVTPGPGADPTVDVDASDAGLPYTFVWDILTDARANPMDGLDTDVTDTTVLAATVFLRFKVCARTAMVLPPASPGAACSGGGGLGTVDGNTTYVQVSIGNQPPEVFVEPFAMPQSGAVLVAFKLADLEADLATVELEVRDDADMIWRTMALSFGSLVGLQTLAVADPQDGFDHFVLWDSAAPKNSDPTVPQGLGSASVTATVRARAGNDSAGGLTFGGWHEAAVTVVNQSAPAITDVRVPAVEVVTPGGPLAIHYRAHDDDGDRVDVELEYSLDRGVTYVPCIEYPQPESEGRYDLLASNAGVAHTFVWDTSSLSVAPLAAARIRLTAHDAGAASAPFEVLLRNPPGPSGAPAGPLLQFDAIYSAGSNITSVAVADFDDDGALDLAVTDRSGNQVRIYLGQLVGGVADGTFAALGTEATAADPRGVIAGYLDNDTHIDLAVMSSSSDVTVLIGAGNGTFTPGTPIPDNMAIPFALGLSAADLDGNGAVDLLLSSNVNTFAVAFGNAPGGIPNATFAPPVLIGPGTNPPAVGDFNCDGDLDVLSSSSWWAGDGTGAFQSVSSSLANVSRAAAGDLDADGCDDVVVAQLLAGFTIAFGDPIDSLVFADARAFAEVGSFESAAIADFNGDGVRDVAVVDSSTDRAFLTTNLAGPASGRVFGPTQPVDITDPGRMTPNAGHRALARDVNGDGVADLVLANRSSPDVTVALSAPHGLDADTIVIGERRVYGGFLAGAEVVDVDLDGAPDLLGASNLGAGSFGRRVGLFGTGEFPDPFGAAGAFRAAVADFNDDYVWDSVDWWSTVDVRLGAVALDGSFTAGETYNVAVTGPIVVADFDRDGDLDLARSDAGANQVVILTGDMMMSTPDGTFTVGNNYTVGNNPQGLAVADINNDGHLDLLTADQGNSSITVLAGNGDGTFVAAPADTYPAGSGPTRVAVADLTGDGYQDVVVANSLNFTAHVLLHTGNPALGLGTLFGAPSAIGGGTRANALRIVELDGDGVDDLVILDDAGVLNLVPFGASRGLGTGAPGLPLAVPGFDGATALSVGDFERDGIPDLVSTHDVAELSTVLKIRDQSLTDPTWRPLLPWPASGGAAAVGAIVPSGASRAGTPLAPATLLQRRSRGVGPSMQRFADALRHSTLSLPASRRELTHAWYTAGDVTLTRRPEPAGVMTPTGPRLEVVQCLGPSTGPEPNLERAPMDLTGGFAAQTGIVIDLPVVGPYTDVQITTGALHVYQRSIDWVRAADWPTDPMTSHADAPRYLPRVPTRQNPTDYRDVYRETSTWRELTPTTDLTVGTGPRFAVELSDPNHRRIRILTDRLGTFQAFIE